MSSLLRKLFFPTQGGEKAKMKRTLRKILEILVHFPMKSAMVKKTRGEGELFVAIFFF